MNRLTTILLAMVLAMAGLSAVVPPATSATTYPEFVAANTTPDQVVFNSASEHLKITQEMDDPVDWVVASATAYICTGYTADRTGCNKPSDFSTSPDWLKYTGDTSPPRAAQRHWLNFEGDIPNSYGGVNRRFSYFLNVIYKMPSGSFDSVSGYTTYNYNGTTYYSFPSVWMSGASKVTLTGPSKIEPGHSLTLGGTLSCYGNVGYKAPDYGYVHVEFRQKGETDWNYMGGMTGYNASTGAWKYTNLAVGASGDWRAVGSGDRCISATSTPLFVDGDGPPPEPTKPPVLPEAPDLSVGGTTSTTAALNWAPPSDTTGITGYRFGWTSSNGLPVPSWQGVDGTTVGSPFVMTNLNPNTTYTMFVEAVTAMGSGNRATVTVHTDAPAKPPSAIVHLPSTVQHLHASPGNKRIAISWWAPSSNGGAAINWYQVVSGKTIRYLSAGARSSLFTHLRNHHRYSFWVRAHNRAGYGAWAHVYATPNRPRRHHHR